jgi:two-component system, OmpR family, manganese sensing sensor histidine kinase
MLDGLSRRLTLLIITVVLLLVTFFAVVVYYWVGRQLEVEDKKDLQTFSHIFCTSIESPEEEASEHRQPTADEPLPDIVEKHGPLVNQQNLGLQWFSKSGRLLSSNGSLPITVPLSVASGFETQRQPHALLLTEPVVRDGKTIGYLRTGLAMDFSDRSRERLRNGLFFAILSSIGLSALATWIIVKEAVKPARRVIKQLTQLTADVSHELKTPITAIKMNADVLSQYSNLEEHEKELVASIAHAAQQMNSTVQDLLLLAQVEAIPAKNYENNATLGSLIADVLSELSVFIEQKGIEIESQLDNPAVRVAASDADLKRALANIVKNAIQFSPQNSKVIILSKAHKSEVLIEVQDFGRGIQPDDQARIFDRFWRADKARSGGIGGSGLGLSIAQTI